MDAISIKKLKKEYKGNVIALDGINLVVKEGDFFGLIGPNGAGKTTLIGILTDLIVKSSGSIKIFNKDIETDFNEAKRLIGVVPQENNFNIFEKVIEIVTSQAGYYGIPKNIALKRAEYYLKQLGLWSKRNTKSNALSGGMKKRLMIVRSLIHEPKILILDEPTAGVDVELRRDMWDFLTKLNNGGKTIILTTHYLEEAEKLCKNIAIINNGKIIENTTMKKLLSKSSEEVFIFEFSEENRIKSLNGYKFNQVDNKIIEVEIMKNQNINDLIKLFDQKDIIIKSIRNKTNRLEELFIKLTEGNYND